MNCKDRRIIIFLLWRGDVKKEITVKIKNVSINVVLICNEVRNSAYIITLIYG